MIGYTSQIQEKFWSFLEVYNTALNVLKDKDTTKTFLCQSHPLLMGKTPITRAMESKKGYYEVLDLIGQIEHGVVE